MIICEKCFLDKVVVIPTIKSMGIIGRCETCESSNVYIYDTEKSNRLGDVFEELISIYTSVRELPDSFPKSEIKMLKNDLIERWNIFNNLSDTTVYNVLVNVCKEKYINSSEMFDLPVGIKELHEEDYMVEHSLLKNSSWQNFVNDIKTKNRFHTNHINLNLLEKFCSYIRKPYKKGDILYRCRVSSNSGFDTESMGAPPSEKASAGRANALGISCLYLGESPETAINEVRAGAFDYVSVGKFELQEDIIVVDLKQINQISPFIEGLDYRVHAINKEHLNKINDEIGKALRISDSVLDYTPTQYITDFIKSIKYNNKEEYAGIEYKSVMNKEGYNLAIFNPKLFTCVDIDIYKISNLKYEKIRLDMN